MLNIVNSLTTAGNVPAVVPPSQLKISTPVGISTMRRLQPLAQQALLCMLLLLPQCLPQPLYTERSGPKQPFMTHAPIACGVIIEVAYLTADSCTVSTVAQ